MNLLHRNEYSQWKRTSAKYKIYQYLNCKCSVLFLSLFRLKCNEPCNKIVSFENYVINCRILFRMKSKHYHGRNNSGNQACIIVGGEEITVTLIDIYVVTSFLRKDLFEQVELFRTSYPSVEFSPTQNWPL